MNFEEDVKKSVEMIKSGKVILYPTDTIWGIGCDATNAKAIQRIFNLKGRTQGKSMIVLLDAEDKLEKYVKQVPLIAFDLIKNSASPITIVYSGAYNLAKNLIAEDGTIAIRIVRDEYCREIISKSGKPLVSTSANISGSPSPGTFMEIDEEVKKKVDYVAVSFRDRAGRTKPSTIIKLEESGIFKVLRP
jgi:L-threonylcarbamoyladenylate synthase